MSLSAKDDKRKEEFPGVADIERGASPTDGTSTREIVISIESDLSQRQEGIQSDERQHILHKLPPEVREKNKQLYEPLVVSLGPYHHGKPHLRRFEDFKDEVLNIILNSDGSAKDRCGVFRSEVLKRVDEVRSFYEGLSTKEYDDEALVTMMLRDACLVLYYMGMMLRKMELNIHMERSMGLLGYSMGIDFFKLENQIPWWVIKLLISIRYDDDETKEEGGAFLCKVMSFIAFGDYNGFKQLPWEEGTEKEPLHFLEAIRIAGLKDEMIIGNLDSLFSNGGNNDSRDKGGQHSLISCPSFKFKWCGWRKRSCPVKLLQHIYHPFRSATELKAKGIYFKPSSTLMNDIRFSSHSCYGVLHLPILVVERKMTAIFSNLVVLEMSPGIKRIPVTSYVNFMKSLIEKPEDAKLLQESGIIISVLEDNERIVKMINEIDTHGANDVYIFDEIKKRIDKHCNSYSKTWVAELIHTNFRSPWTAVALFAATFLLCLTFLQTYYTMNQKSSAK